jgi:ATP-dependent Clp protease ATP-binding subunit ClpA
MFERFTDRARRVVVLARQEARRLDHDHVGTEHILLGLLCEGKGVGVKALVALGIDLQDVRQQVEGLIGRGPEAPSGHIPFTGPAKRVLELSLREALQFGHNYIGTEHITLGLIGEEDGVAARVLAGVGADAGRVRRQVILLLHGYSGTQSRQTISPAPAGQSRRTDEIHRGIEEILVRLTAIEDALSIPSSPMPESVRELSRRIALVRREKEAALDARQFDQAARLHEQEKQLTQERRLEGAAWLAEPGRGSREPDPAGSAEAGGRGDPAEAEGES